MSQANIDITEITSDVREQAQQGSVAAIIQVLNEDLADTGIRTRAVIADGMLQLLCEAPAAEQLPQGQVVPRIREILNDLAPRHIRRVNICSRLVREQQLLWLEEITREPEKYLLWSEVVILKAPPPLVQIRRLWGDVQQSFNRKGLPKGERIKRRSEERKALLRGIMGGASLCLLLVLGGWGLKNRLGIRLSVGADTIPAPATSPQVDPFAQAIRIAEQAAQDGLTADTAAEWLDLAARWQRASDLMAQVPATDGRAATAQDRVEVYRNNSEQALARSRQFSTESEP